PICRPWKQRLLSCCRSLLLVPVEVASEGGLSSAPCRSNMATNKTCLDRQREGFSGAGRVVLRDHPLFKRHGRCRRSGRSRVRIAAGAFGGSSLPRRALFRRVRWGDGRSGAIRARFGVFVWISRPPNA